MNYRKELQEKGYCIIESLFSKEEISSFREEIITYLETNKQKLLKNANGFSIPNFVEIKQLSKTASILKETRLHSILKDVFNKKPYRFCQHNDIGINRIVEWHKDKLNGAYAKYQSHNIWKSYQGQSHEIIKVLIYLQDHSDNKDGLQVVPKSHLTPKIEPKKVVILQPKLGDIIVFDQRITHRGMEKQVKNKRMLVSFGFGKNNIFTDEFEKGTVLRQNSQKK